MELLKRYKFVLIIVIPILILVLIRQFGVIHFKSDAAKWAELSAKQANIIFVDQINILTGEKLIINMEKEAMELKSRTVDVINIPADSILYNRHLKTIKKYEGTILIYSNEEAISARVWMILSQMGIKNIYILSDCKDVEVFKHKFQPDSLIRPELFQ